MDNSFVGLENDGKNWNWSETLLAFDLYTKSEYSKISEKNQEVRDLAKLLKRKPGAVKKKMFNIAAHDPKVIERGESSLNHSSKLDSEIWVAFEKDTLKLANDIAFAWAEINNIKVDNIVENLHGIHNVEVIPEGAMREQVTRVRIGQLFFRNAVLSAYGHRCCITGLSEPQLLIASHIKPWRDSDAKTEKTNPRNGLCLNSLHDRAFDQGLLTVKPTYEIVISDKLKRADMDEETKTWLLSYNKKKIVLPDKFFPEKEFLEYHNDVIFQK